MSCSSRAMVSTAVTWMTGWRPSVSCGATVHRLAPRVDPRHTHALRRRRLDGQRDKPGSARSSLKSSQQLPALARHLISSSSSQTSSPPGFRRRFDGLSDEAKLRRVPRGFPPDHPAAEWLKLQPFTARVFIEPSVVTSSRLLDRLCRYFELLVPLVRWLDRALGYQPAKARSSAPPVPARRGRGSGRRSRRA
jgi:Conserved hypothetical protein (DUF2461)